MEFKMREYFVVSFNGNMRLLLHTFDCHMKLFNFEHYLLKIQTAYNILLLYIRYFRDDSGDFLEFWSSCTLYC